jgi:hypothetical protein
LKWSEVTQDEQGHGTKISRYEAQILPCDVSGNVLDKVDDKWTIRTKVKQPARYANVKLATNPSGNTFRFECRTNHGQSVNNQIIASGFTPSAYNGTWTVSNIVNPTTLEVTGGSSGVGDSTAEGKIEDADDRLHITMEKVPKPKTWYWKARVRAVDSKDCRGDWSAWTTPILPWAGADPVPPTPTYGANPITFDNKGKGKHSKIRLKFLFNEVQNFDYPGTPAEDEDDVIGYGIQIDRSDDGITWDGAPYRTISRPAKDADADSTVTAIFQTGIRRRYWYRCRVRCIDRFNRKSLWSNWTDAALPFDDDRPPQPLLVRIFESSTDRVVLDWDDPVDYIPTRGTVTGTSGTATLTGTNTQFEKEVERGSTIRVDGNNYLVKSVASATSLTLATNLSTSPSGSNLRLVEEHPDVAFYQVQIAKSADVSGTPNHDWSAVYMKDRRNGTRKAFKIADADRGLTFYGRVRSVDAAWNKSKWVYGRFTANSDETLSGEGVTVGAGGGKVIATWSKVGRARVKHYSNRRWTNTTGQRLYFKKARATCGDKEAATGAPTGASLQFNIRYWPADESTSSNIFDTDARLEISAGTYKDVNGPNTFQNRTYIDPDEALTVKVATVGSTYPGDDWTVQLMMDP